MRTLTRTLAISACVLASTAITSTAWAQTHRIDPQRSSITFSVPYDFMIVGMVEGRFQDFSGEASIVDGDVTHSSVEVKIEARSVDTALEARDLGLRGEYFFAAEQYPTIEFVSRAIEPEGDDYVMVGDLTLRGVTRETRIPFQLFEFGDTLMVLGQTKLTRLDFGMEGPLPSPDIVIGDRVTVRMSLTLVPVGEEG